MFRRRRSVLPRGARARDAGEPSDTPGPKSSSRSASGCRGRCAAAPVLQLLGVASTSRGDQRVHDVRVHGVDASFYALAPRARGSRRGRLPWLQHFRVCHHQRLIQKSASFKIYADPINKKPFLTFFYLLKVTNGCYYAVRIRVEFFVITSTTRSSVYFHFLSSFA